MPEQFSDCPQLLRDFLFYLQTIKGRSMKTVNAYYIDLRTFLRYLAVYKYHISSVENFNTVPIDQLTIEQICSVTLSDIYEFLNFTLSERSNSAKTRSRKVSSIRTFYKYLNTKTNYLPINPTKDLDVPSIKKSVPIYLSLEESLELLNAASNQLSERDFCIITLFLNCGMRLSELVGINLTDIKENTLRLLGKGNKERIIYINQACIDAIAAYLPVRPTPKGTNNKNALFLSRNGTRLTGRRVEQIVQEALKTAGLNDKGYSPHKLRHTAATLMYQHGDVDIRILKEILGHVNLGTTEIYTHISNKQLQKAADASPLSHVKPKKKPTL